MTGWCWLALLPDCPSDALAAAAATEDGDPVGVLAAWPAGRKPVRSAVRCDAAFIDPAGGPVWLSYLLLPPDRAPLFDDPAVSQALRAVLAGPPFTAVSTLVRDASTFAGSVVAFRADRPDRLRDDPFTRLGRPRLLRVEAGLVGSPPPPAGPAIQRYAGKPWPAAGF
jgi:hypothetical protein